MFIILKFSKVVKDSSLDKAQASEAGLKQARQAEETTTQDSDAGMQWVNQPSGIQESRMKSQDQDTHEQTKPPDTLQQSDNKAG